MKKFHSSDLLQFGNSLIGNFSTDICTGFAIHGEKDKLS
jgi:hypothetical protein